ncbi:GGDEF domain-containing protein [Kushneria indalinina]|uniref:diguanylate cyclase n=1 Tax=Kushneria indalinina DSM 14324 TaxID=1122140 RepID=A0A3D9DWX5_9GAMM|nr:GGDEF domain-containing protein [Kushneria indalinina]REC95282.1 diguanylate cyclase (GGDEF)-like protein [Kushneria indalinina DSM 14324]
MQEEATELDRALEGRGWLGRVAIPPGRMGAFAAQTQAMRRHALSMSVLIGLGFYLAFAAGDWFTVPDQVWLALTFRFAIMLPLGLAVLYWLHHVRSSLMVQQVVTCGFHLLAVSLLAFLVTRSDSANALGFVFASYAALMAMVISMALPVRLVMVLAITVMLVQALAIAFGPIQLPILQLHNLMTAIVIVGPALFANRTLENERRRHFLLIEREESRKRQLAEQRDMLSRLAALDPLTDIANRRGFHAALASDLGRVGPDALVAIAMVDIDHFKLYNDHYGHAAGDRALRRVAQALAEAAGPVGRAGRLGGEEFIIAVTGISSEEIELYAERLRASVQRLALAHCDSSTADVVTVSVGVVLGLRDRADIPTLFETADAALYRAKAAGRNRVVIHDLPRPNAEACRTG